MIEQGRKAYPRRENSRLSKYYIRSGVVENSFCVRNPKYEMSPPTPREQLERAGLDDIVYR